MWMEILKLLISSAIATIVLSFIFNKKLERHKMFLKVSEQYLSSLIIGLNEFMGDFKAVVVKAEEIETQLRTDTFTEQSWGEFSSVVKKFNETIKGHRIYLAPFIPFGISNEDVGMQEMDALRLSLEMLLDENAKDNHARIREICLNVIPKFKEKYSLTSDKANLVTQGVFEGKSPFKAVSYASAAANKLLDARRDSPSLK